MTATIICAVMMGAVMTGCARNKNSTEIAIAPAEQLYSEAQDLLDKKDYATAAKYFEEIDRQHPYSKWGIEGQIMSIWSWYKANNTVNAIAAAERFIRLHPVHKDIAYVYYLQGLVYFDQISDVERDQKMTEDALHSFEQLITRFPNSKYTRDARVRVEMARDNMAGKEMNVGRYYQNLKHYIAAINRFRTVVDKYQTTTHTPEALYRMVESYLSIGLIDEAQKSASVLGYNFPNSIWYRDAYNMIREVRPAIIASGVPIVSEKEGKPKATKDIPKNKVR